MSTFCSEQRKDGEVAHTAREYTGFDNGGPGRGAMGVLQRNRSPSTAGRVG